MLVDLELARRGVPTLSAERQATRDRLLAAARVVFERDGFRKSRITDISHLGGLAHGGFYRYFDSKEAVLLELAEAASERLGTPFDGVTFDSDSLDDLPDLLAAGIRRYLEVFQDEARILTLLGETGHQNERLRARSRDPRRPAVARHVEQVRRLQRRGLVDGRVSPEIMVFALVGMLELFAERWLVDRTVAGDLDMAVTQLTRMCLHALRLTGHPAHL
ncbi:TetR/AcrR family transcriptional regulator [Frankia sp. AgB1.9]|uniref:TetR/AcrR family transcriptional regulator n=1 Tax=unclassified Frankia TaxID=2632575 RepID=UPI001931BFC8|nr:MULTISPECIES: TetR/AcrR family transcriptional regulator [unclassified Frankia]MBL7490984.1 TetR/AcrR family transcriptional regulator [Frankia sp. AgW1.1]MBL7548780.1 TetR/AcrR family transcriptional regulator [Frankia sp. AgB1.9]MBL7623887.1 TetR/AcrR family transcriptional regulator [Frankia sp. AgB1.8]